MESAREDLLKFQTVSLNDILDKSVSIRKSSPKIFIQIALAFILPLSFTILARSLFTFPLLSLIPIYGLGDDQYKWTQFFIFELFYPMFVFVFSLLSTAAVVFTVTSIYASRPVSFSITISAIPKVYKRLFITFIFFSFFLILCNIIVMGSLMMYASSLDIDNHPILFGLYFIILYCLIFFPIYTYITALWHLASVVSVLEPLSGLAAMRKSKKLLKGNTVMAMEYVSLYLGACYLAEALMFEVYGWLGHKVLPIFFSSLVSIGILPQSIFYFMCKSYHEEETDRNALFDHLAAYVGKYVPVKGIEMQDLDI
ncbi:hypothetical protein ACHQM5_015572 [Ranunculus cassubicifolius]